MREFNTQMKTLDCHTLQNKKKVNTSRGKYKGLSHPQPDSQEGNPWPGLCTRPWGSQLYTLHPAVLLPVHSSGQGGPADLNWLTALYCCAISLFVSVKVESRAHYDLGQDSCGLCPGLTSLQSAL